MNAKLTYEGRRLLRLAIDEERRRRLASNGDQKLKKHPNYQTIEERARQRRQNVGQQ